MFRREAVSALLAAALNARAGTSLDRFFESSQGCALVVHAPTRRLVAVRNSPAAAARLVPPGSTLKPFVLQALLRAGKLDARESFPCPGSLAIAGRSFNCSHPPLGAPVQVSTALAYSCNCFVARCAARFAPGELARALERAGLASPTGLLGPSEAAGRIRSAASPDAIRLQALGEDGVLVTAAALAATYRTLAVSAGSAELQPVVEGLEGAVEFGTAQLARVPGWNVAGKTGSATAGDGARIAWFAGFAPARAPQVVVTVALEGRSGGANAAPVAARIFEACRAGRL